MYNTLPAYKNIIVLGAGESGVGAALLAKQKGYNVFVSDRYPIKEQNKHILNEKEIPFEENIHTKEKILKADYIIKSPGIDPKSPLITAIIDRKIPIIDETEWAYIFKGNSKIIAISGSNGKSTTVSLLYHIFKSTGQNVALVGNIGHSFARQIAEAPKDIYIIEMSSFQLDGINHFKADIALLLNITEDHLNRYDHQFEKYIQSKLRIIKNQTEKDIFIYCADDTVINKALKNKIIHSSIYTFSMFKNILKGAFLKEGELHINTKEETWSMDFHNLPLKGKHNAYNMLAASITASAFRIHNKEIQKALQGFQGLEHRMELVGIYKEIEFINDSKATNIHATWYALESMQKPTILILGGIDKGNDYEIIKELVKEKVKAIIAIGKENDNIIRNFTNIVPVISTHDMKTCVEKAYQWAESENTILLSPACASFDLFKNYEDRGLQFKKEIHRICS